MLEKRTKQLLAIAPRLIRGRVFDVESIAVFDQVDVESTYVFLRLSSYCQYFLCFWPLNCHNLWPIIQAVLWPIMQAVLLIFPTCWQEQTATTRFIHSNFQWSTQVWFLISPCRRLQELFWPGTALYALLHVDRRHWRGRYTHKGSGRGRAGCRRDLDVGGGKACADSWRGCLCWLARTTPASASSPRLRARARAPAAARLMCASPRRGAGASTCQGCRRQSALLNKWTFCSSTVPTDWTITVMQWEIKWLWPGRIPARLSGQTRHFGSITSLLPVFPHYYHHYYLLDHHYYIHYTLLFHIITCYYGNNVYIITHYYICY